MSKEKENLVIKDNVVIERIRKSDGKVLDRETFHNLVVNSGKVRIAKLLGNVDSATYFKAIAIGLGSSADTVSATDVALVDEVARETATAVYKSDYKCKFSTTFSFASGEAYSIKEVGLFDSVVESGSVMLDRLICTEKSVDSDVDLKVTITITVN
ncbi:MAG: hypothetical protein DRH15_04175 [Deltaproteobacteria bacterium]|nr:MAG: hypothetical protein DRH15_04175 [Deltaproteobacteria bacterium]